jgi:serine/threonine protein kinase
VDEFEPLGFVHMTALGEGGMGTVFRAEHAGTGLPVAIKMVRGISDARSSARFHDEVKSHASLTHPGIVYLFEYGSVGEERFVAMELADATLRDRLPLRSWSEVRDILLQVLDALAYAHARDVIHRDLKPENLLWFETDDGPQIKLADFGIAHVTTSVIDQTTGLLASPVGTPHYMPVEQLAGKWREYGPWTDLYALGCITYELVCGRRPFAGCRDLMTLMMAHANEPRPELVPLFEVPAALTDWVHTAMAVQPGDRFGRAADALVALPPPLSTADRAAPLVALDETLRLATETFDPLAATDTIRPEEMATSTPTAPPTTPMASVAELPPLRHASRGTVDRLLPERWERRLRGPIPAPLVGAGLGLFGLRLPPFSGRTREREVLWRGLLEAAESKSPRVVIIEGEAGVGKSRLSAWFSRRAHETGAAHVFQAQHTAGETEAEGVSGMLQRAFHTWRLSRKEALTQVVRMLPRFPGESQASHLDDAKALVEMSASSSDPSPPLFHFDSSGQRNRVVVRMFQRFARSRPVLVWFDDSHWGPDSIEITEMVLQDHSTDICVVSTVRSDYLRLEPTLRARFERMADRQDVTVLPLGPLPREEYREMLSGLLPLSPPLLESLVHRTEGNPLFTTQLLSHWVTSGVVEIGDSGFDVSDEERAVVPEDIHDLWMSRVAQVLARVPGGERDDDWQALEIAATLGRLVDAREWAAAVEHLQVTEDLASRLILAGLGTKSRTGWRFLHVLLADALERRADDHGRAQSHHRRCAAALTAVYPGQLQETAGRRAFHMLAAGDREGALEPLISQAHFEYKRGNGPKRDEILQQRSALLEELKIDSTDPRRLENDLEQSMLWFYLGRTSESESLAEGALRAAGGEPSEFGAYAAQMLLMNARRRGAATEARGWGERALWHADAIGADWWYGSASLEQAWLELHQPRRDQCAAHCHKGIEIMATQGDLHQQFWARFYLSWLELYEGHEEEAFGLFETMVDESRRAGFRVVEGYCAQGLAVIHRMAGRYDDARAEMAHFDRLAGWQVCVRGVVEMELASIEVHAGCLPAARKHLEEAERLFESIEGTKYTAWTDVIRLALLAHEGNWPAYERLFGRYASGWPVDYCLTIEHPLHLELAATAAADERPELANRTMSLATTLWETYDRPDQVRRLKQR